MQPNDPLQPQQPPEQPPVPQPDVPTYAPPPQAQQAPTPEPVPQVQLAQPESIQQDVPVAASFEPAPQPTEGIDHSEPAFEGAQSADHIQWQAPEYIAHPKPPIWFIGFWAFVVVLMAIAAFVVKSWSFTILVPVMAAALVMYSHRPPHMISYVLSAKGLYINDVLHSMSEFRSFGIIHDETIPALMLIPVRRFRPGLTVYFQQENGEAIVDFLGSRIPMQELRLDVFDRIVRKLRI